MIRSQSQRFLAAGALLSVAYFVVPLMVADFLVWPAIGFGCVVALYIQVDGSAQDRAFDTIIRLAHEFKGASANLGLLSLAAVCGQMELRARGRDADVASLSEDLRAELERALGALASLQPLSSAT